jgi:AraC-like DNA-binding protein
LAIGQLSIALASFVAFALVSKLMVHWPFLYRLAHPLALIFIPMPYLHVVFYTKNRRWKWVDLIHAIPLLVFLVDYGHVLLLSNAEKLLIIKQEINDLNFMSEFRQSRFFPPRFHQDSRSVLLSVYWLTEVIVLAKWLKSQTHITRQNRIWKNWILLFLVCQFFMWSPFYLHLFGLKVMTSFHVVTSFSIVWLLISSLSLFFVPTLLYGNTQISENTKNAILKKAPPSAAEEKKWDQLMKLIEDRMALDRLFLKPGLNINDFSREIQVPVYQVSRCLNSKTGLGFVDYINQQRIQYCVSKFSQGQWLNLTLEAIAEECGFSNRNSFTKAFKKFNGQSPSDYRMALEKNSFN